MFIDADGCPFKDEVYRATGKYGLTVYVVCNAPMFVPNEDRIQRILVPKGPDVADDWIAENVAQRDIVVTTDIPLADRCLKKGARVLDARGREWTDDSIGSAKASRDLMEHLRAMGMVTGGPPPVEKKTRSEFISKLHQVIQSLVRSEGS